MHGRADHRRSRRRIFLTIGLVIFAALPAYGDTVTTCTMGSHTPGYRAIRLDLPDGADFLSIEPKSKRPLRVSDDANWHLAQGLVVVDADTLDVAAARVEAYGTTPRKAVVRSDGEDAVRADLVTPDGPFYHQASRAVPTLDPGTYYAIGFGSDGDASVPNEWWAFDLRISGRHSCVGIGTGHVFDVDHTDFTGGDQVYVNGVGMADGIEHTHVEGPDTDIVVGLMDVAVQGPGEAVMSFDGPLSSGEIDDEIVPFASTAGVHTFQASYAGAFPQILIAGVGIDLP